MAKIKTFTLSNSKKISVDYNSYQSAITISVELEDEDDINQIKEQLSDKINKGINSEIIKMIKDDKIGGKQ